MTRKSAEYDGILDVIIAAQKLCTYFTYHNKNLTKAQDWIIDDLAISLEALNDDRVLYDASEKENALASQSGN